ncbi:hypothetical protein [Salipiger marinus]|uniref:hypothetical protein n=1 Tax=Salipiger marinus TaxID=555512 RepID=UPI0040593545
MTSDHTPDIQDLIAAALRNVFPSAADARAAYDAALAQAVQVERKRAEALHRRAQKSEGKLYRISAWLRTLKGVTPYNAYWPQKFLDAALRIAPVDGGTAGEAYYYFMSRKLRELEAEVQRLREALTFYADEAFTGYAVDISMTVGAIIKDAGDKARAALSDDPAPAAHFDDIAVDRFAAAMKTKLAKKRADGRGGWEDKLACSQQFLSDLLRGHANKPDPVDVGNFAMMLHQRGEEIAPAPAVTVAEHAQALLDAYASMPTEAKLAAVKAHLGRDSRVQPVAVIEAWRAALRALAERGAGRDETPPAAQEGGDA